MQSSSASYTTVAFEAPHYKSFPSPFYQDLRKWLVQLDPEKLFKNVRINYEFVTYCAQKNGPVYPSSRKVFYHRDMMTAKELLRIVSCAAPNTRNPTLPDDVEFCWNNPPKVYDPQGKA